MTVYTPTIRWRRSEGPVANIVMMPETVIEGVPVRLLDLDETLDLGRAEWEPFEAPRAGHDGMAYFGGVFSEKREITLPLYCRCGDLASALDFKRKLHYWFNNHAEGYLQIERLAADGVTEVVSRAQCYAGRRQAFVQRHTGGGEGHIGSTATGNMLYIVTLYAPYPHFRSDPIEHEGTYPTDDALTITNLSANEVGMSASFVKVSGTVNYVEVRNVTTGRYLRVATTLADQLEVDWMRGTPNLLSVRQNGVDFMPFLNVGAKMKLIPGANNIEINVGGTAPVVEWDLAYCEEHDEI